jgi:DNA-binding transcriptional MerR regulator
MLKIGEFAKLCGASVQTLRYYDEVGVLCADSIDPDSGYRYYRPEQAETFRSIALFKEIGFSLDEIRLLMRGSEDENSRQFNKKREALIMEMRRMRLMVSRLDAMVSEPERTRRHPEQHKLVTVNSWNEWTETSYLEPDNLNGYGYLEAVKRVFWGE